jgi:hypothetical protein
MHLEMCCNRKERNKAMIREGEIQQKGEVCTLRMRCNKEEIKSFNVKENMRTMARERKRAFAEGRRHTQVWETLQQRGERAMARGRERKNLTKEKQ